MARLVQHPYFYLATVTFQVENTLFKVPRRPFDSSDVFTTMFSLPPGEGVAVDGSDDEHPLKLEYVNRSDFEGFLKALFPSGTVHDSPPMSTDDWKAALKLATMWDFETIRGLSISKLKETTDTVAQIQLARQYRVFNWLFACCETLVTRKEPISEEEAARLGLSMAIRLLHVREELRSNPMRSMIGQSSIAADQIQNFLRYGPQILPSHGGNVDRSSTVRAEEIWKKFEEELKEAGGNMPKEFQPRPRRAST